TNRAKCSSTNSMNGMSWFFASAMPSRPGTFIVASSSFSASMCPSRIGAATMKDDCGVMANGPHQSGEQNDVGMAEDYEIFLVACRDNLFTTQQIGKEGLQL